MIALRRYSFSLIFIGFFVLSTSCEGILETILEEQAYEADMQVRTMEPEIGASNVIFRGALQHIADGEEVDFGFMWYKADEENPVIHRIILGTRSTKGEFATSITTLPKEVNLVVCAYIIESKPTEQEVVGDEKDFSWGF